MRWFLRSKILKATITQADVNYVGSITIDKALIDKVGLIPGEKVLVVSNTSGARLETYVMTGKENSGIIGMNGASALLIKKGEEVIIMGFELANAPVTPQKMLVDKNNAFVKYIS